MTVTKTFGYTGGWQTYVIPAGITSVSVTIDGAGSGSRGGARCTGSFAVSPGQTLYLVVGGAGGITSTATAGAAGWGGGGSGGTGVNAKGGAGGGGYSAIRIGSTSGTLKGLAGGAGGDSGDGGAGGAGGSGTGGRGNAGSGSITLATGGSNNNGGTGGTSSSGSEFNGANGAPLGGNGGHGGNTGGFDGPGGGGGGGGYGSGGGGTGGSSGYAPGGGGGGGGSYVGGLSGATHTPGGGGAGNGSIVIVHADPNNAPNTPTLLTPATGAHTLSTGSVDFSATVSDPNNDNVRALFRVSTSSTFTTYTDFYGSTVSSGGTSSGTATGLSLNTHYYVRCYAQDSSNVFSVGYDTGDFYTNLVPNAPTNILPASNTATLSTGTLNVSATVSDPDGGTVRALFRYSTDGFTSYTDVYSDYVNSGQTATVTLSGLTLDTLYQLEVYAQDPQGQFSNNVTTSFYTNRTPTAPTLISPANNEIFDNTQIKTFSWMFNDPDISAGDSQSNASIRWRPNGSSTWTTVSNVGVNSSYQFAANTFTANVTYEWQVQTVDTGGAVGPWSASNLFSASPAASGMNALGGMSLVGLDTLLPASTMIVNASMPIGGIRTQSAGLSIPVVAQLNSTSFSQVNKNLSISSIANMSLVQSQILPYSFNMIGNSILSLTGNKLVDSTQLVMTAQAGMPIQITLGSTAMAVQVMMAVAPNPLLLQPSLNMISRVILTSNATSSSGSHISMVAQAFLGSGGMIARSLPLSMLTKGSLSQSGALLEQSGMTMAARVQMALAGFSAPLASQTMHVIGQMIQSAQLREDSTVHFLAKAGMIVSNDTGMILAIVPMGASAVLSIASKDINTSTNQMIAVAALTINQNQLVYEGPYLIVPSVDGSTMSFSLSSFPTPRGVRNSQSVSNVRM